MRMHHDAEIMFLWRALQSQVFLRQHGLALCKRSDASKPVPLRIMPIKRARALALSHSRAHKLDPERFSITLALSVQRPASLRGDTF